MTATTDLGRRSSVARLTVFAAVVLLALGVRAWRPAHLGIDHYDEGVYAISADAVVTWPDGDLFPGQVRFSPPIWFAGVGVVSRVLDAPTDQVALWLNVVVGALTALAATVIAAHWFGLPTAAAAGTLVALDPLSLMLSRSGLTDATFALLFLLAVAATVALLNHGGKARMLLAGLAVGLAWNAKYHGWFVIVIGAGAFLAMWLRGRRHLDAAVRLAGAAAVAALIYLPWALYMRGASGGRGLRGIVAYYLTLIGGDWLANAGRYLAMLGYLDAPLIRIAAPLAVAAALVTGRHRPTWPRLGVVLAPLAIVTILAGGFAAISLLAAVGVVIIWRRPLEWSGAVLLAWLVLWLVSAPLYHPYLRLLLPLMIVMALLAGRGVGAAVIWTGRAGRGLATPAAGLACVVTALLLVWAPTGWQGAADPWHDGRGAARAAAWLDREVPPGRGIQVVGEPSVAYHLRRLGREATAVVDELASLDTTMAEVWVAAGVYARRAPSIRGRLEALGGRRDSVGAYRLDPGDLRLLDDLSPGAARAHRRRPGHAFDIVLYRVASREAGLRHSQVSAR